MDMGTERIVSQITRDTRISLFYKLSQYDRYLQGMRYRHAYAALCQRIVGKLFTDGSSPAALAALKLLSEIIEYEGFLSVPDIDVGSSKLATSAMWETTGELSRIIDSFDKEQELEERLENLLRAILLESDLGERESRNGDEAELSVPLYVLLPDPAQAVERIVCEILSEARIESRFFRLWPQLERNLLIASGIDPSVETSRQPIWPGQGANGDGRDN
jgi:hypothetical protein